MAHVLAASTKDWLLEGEPWVELRTRLDLLGEDARSVAVRDAYEAMVAHPEIAALCRQVMDAWAQEIVTSHKKADLAYQRLAFLADAGLRAADEPGAALVRIALSRLSAEGVPLVGICVPVHFGGPGQNALGWALCDTPSILASVLAMGGPPKDLRPQMEAGIRHLVGLARQEGFPCAVSAELGRFRGPGRKEDPCPYATLLMLKVLQQLPDDFDTGGTVVSDLVCQCADCLLSLWENSRARHPYLFYMGTDFRKVKAPLVWYDLVHVADVLSRCPSTAGDNRMRDMVSVLFSQADAEGRFTPQSVWKAWSGWDFGQKKAPSRWLTLLAWRIARRTGMA